nr:MAG TPA: hypothetical protein [Caudoviricetes sp.]
MFSPIRKASTYLNSNSIFKHAIGNSAEGFAFFSRSCLRTCINILRIILT